MMRLFAVLFLGFALPVCSFAETYQKITDIEIIRVYDGDTFICNIKNYPELIGKKISVRIAGIDTPEKRDKRPDIRELAYKAKEYTARRLKSAKVIELRNVRRGKYFRIVAEVWIDGNNLSEELIKNKLAKAYDGGKKEPW